MPTHLPPPPLPAIVEIEYYGYWALIDWPITISANGRVIDKIPFLKPANIILPVQGNSVHLYAKMWFRTANFDLAVQPGMRYKVTLLYDRILGSISFQPQIN